MAWAAVSRSFRDLPISNSLIERWPHFSMQPATSPGLTRLVDTQCVVTMASKGKAIAGWLSDHKLFKTHARPIPRDEFLQKGMTGIRALEQDQTEQDLALSVHHAAAHTFSSTAVVKIIENNLGKAYVRSVLQQLQIVPPPMPTPPQPPAVPRPTPPAGAQT